jgi:spore coat polysaccharide biosynthesis protein SpsF
MKRVVIVQARMSSTRLPGKILADLLGKPMLARQLDRLQRCREFEELVIATTINTSDDPVVELARSAGVDCFRGDEHDVLGRYLGAAREVRADLVVRVTADCPLIDPEVADRVIRTAAAGGVDRCDYASNTLTRTYPLGLDVEAFTMEVLERMAREARSDAAREHVTYYLHREHPERFVCREVKDVSDNSDLRWTVDTPDDLELIRRIYERARLDRDWVPYSQLLEIVRSDPALVRLNQHVRQKET